MEHLPQYAEYFASVRDAEILERIRLEELLADTRAEYETLHTCIYCKGTFPEYRMHVDKGEFAWRGAASCRDLRCDLK